MQSLSSNEQSSDAKAKFEIGAGWRYGFILGFVLVGVGWGWDAWQLATASAELFAAKMLLAVLLVMPLTVIAALRAAHSHGSFIVSWITWSIWGILITIIAFDLPFDGLTLIAGLLDPTVWSMSVFPFAPAARILGGFTTIIGALAGFPVALLQTLSTEWAWDRSSRQNRLTAGGWLSLCVCVPLGFGLALICDYMANATLRAPMELANRVVRVALSTPPDLDITKMSTRQMLEYEAGLPWRGRLSPRFVQYLADYDPDTLQQLTVDMDFDNGLLLRCQTNQYGLAMAGCFDLAANYRDALTQFFITGAAPCRDCTIQVQAGAAAWQARRRVELGVPQRISVHHHSGSVVTVTADLNGGYYAECRFVGVDPVLLLTCSGGS